MKVIYAAAYASGSQRARMLNVVRTAEGLSTVADEVVLLNRRGPMRDREALARLYGVQPRFRWVEVPGWIERTVFPAWVLPWLLRQRPDLVIARHWTLPLWAARAGLPSILEAHDLRGARGALAARLKRAAYGCPAFRGVAVKSEAHRQAYLEAGLPDAKVATLPCPADTGELAPPQELPPSPFDRSRPVAVYTGHLYDRKGIPQILDAAERVPGVDFHLVGGMPEDVARVHERIEARGLTNVALHGMQPKAALPPWLWHADVLLLPPPHCESPLKLPEYLASGTPVVASDQSGIRDLVGSDEVFLARAGDGADLARVVRYALDHPEEARRRAQAGLELAPRWSYARHAERLVAFYHATSPLAG